MNPMFYKKVLKVFLQLLFLGTIISVVYFLPRFLVKTIGEQSPWISYIYTYGLGSFFFISSLILLLNQKIHLRRRKQVKIFISIVTLMLLWGIVLHGSWIFLALKVPFKGVM